jgi:transcriptional regulator with PAS, ATPase and Fis domain
MIGGDQNITVNCRIIIATNTNLKQAIELKQFREDLYFRLNRFEINLPSLRNRPNDIPELINYFLNFDCDESSRKIVISDELMNSFINYKWPGNVRELKNCVDRLKILNPEKEVLNLEDLNFIRFQGTNQIMSTDSLNKTINQDLAHNFQNENKLVDDPILSVINQKGFKVNKRLEFLKDLFQKYKKLTRGQVTEIAKVNPITASKDLKILCAEGFIEKRTPTKSVRSNYYQILDIPS